VAKRQAPQRPVFDRVPPQSIEAERSVLGAMLLNPEAVGAAIEILKANAADVFYVEAHQHVYEAAVLLYQKSMPVDAVTLVEQLTRNGVLESVGGATYVAELAGAVPTSANVEHYARLVLDTSILRRVISACTQVASEAYGAPDDVETLLDRAEASIFAIAESRQTSKIHSVTELLADSIDRIEKIIKSKTGYTGLPTGFRKLDEMLSGLQKSDMVVLAARPSVGKTAFALNVAANVGVRQQKGVLLFSLEMAKEQLVQRLLCMEGRINSQRLRSGFLADREFPKLQIAAEKLNGAPIFIDDTPNIGVLDIRSKARRKMAEHPIELVIIDYLQLMQGTRRAENRQTEISEISRSIKGIARELRVPVIALSQLSREAEKDDTGIPKLSHLRESGAIEQDADVVLMLSRPPAHKHEELAAKFGPGTDPEKVIQLMIAKQRNGPTGHLDLMFDRDVQIFGDLTLAGATEEAPVTYFDPADAIESLMEDDDVPF